MQFLSNETFWISVAFFAFFGMAFGFIRSSVLQSVDGRIKLIHQVVSDAQCMRNKAHAELIQMKNEYQQALERNDRMIKAAKLDAEAIVRTTEEQIAQANANTEELLQKYYKQAENKMIESLKNDVIVTVISIIEAEMLEERKHVKHTDYLAESKKLLKKVWN